MQNEKITQILDNLFERELASLGELCDEEGSASERFLEFMRISLKDLIPMLKHMQLTYEFYTFARREETVRNTIEKYFRSYVVLLILIIQQGIDNSEFQAITPGRRRWRQVQSLKVLSCSRFSTQKLLTWIVLWILGFGCS